MNEDQWFLHFGFFFVRESTFPLTKVCVPLGTGKACSNFSFSWRFKFLLKCFPFSVRLQWFPLFCLPAHWSIPLYHLIYCWFPLEYFLLLFSSALFGSLYFLTLRWKSHYAHPFFSLVCIFTVITLNSVSGRLRMSTSFSSFSKVMSHSFTWNTFLCLILPNFVFISVV